MIIKLKKLILPTICIFIISCSNDNLVTQNSPKVNRPITPISTNEVQIGNQIWMTKNLNVSKYTNGDIIPQVTNQAEWENLTTGAWCYYINDTQNGKIYGKLYNWYAVNDPRGLAPEGYHIPSKAEWLTLISNLGGVGIAGGKLKATTLWNQPNTGATNATGFTGYPAGQRLLSNLAPVPNFNYIGTFTVWWTSNEDDLHIEDAFGFAVNSSSSMTIATSTHKNAGCSIRCIKN